ncbi:MAG TPA: ABC transporter permease [Candidatus Limnocylindrales bacterium]|nr:ABC transporter permease [Candidatus Limnocylindrales bacterium]
MNPLRAFSTVGIALRALGRNKLRSILTALGIIIGVGAVISMVGIGSGAKAQVAAQVASLGENVVMVYAASSSSSTGVRLGYGSTVTLSVEDAEAIAAEVPRVVAVSPEVYSFGQVVAGNQNWKTKIYGEGEDFLKIREWELAAGENFGEADVRGANKVALIGQTTARQLFGEESPIGEIVRIQNVPFTVVGSLEAKGFSVKGHDQDDVIIIPYSTALKRLMGPATPLYAINLEAADSDSLEEVQKQTTELLRQRHRISGSREDDFVVRNQQEIAATASATARTMTLLLGAIASVSLVVGGIGIMNIMLVSVTERTREIGLRMAIGARSADILRQFLVEAFTLSSLGGVLGVVVGIGASKVLAATAHWPTLISLDAILLAVLFSGTVGIFFGYYPARKAAQLDPIDALRYE